MGFSLFSGTLFLDAAQTGKKAPSTHSARGIKVGTQPCFATASMPIPLSPSKSVRPASTDTPHFWAVLPCAGTGSRALPAGLSPSAQLLPKQYQILAGQPLVLHTLAAFAPVARLQGTLVAVAPEDHFLDDYANLSFFTVGCGGPTRAETVLGGLRALLTRGAHADDWALVHDAARCLVTPEQIDALIDDCMGDDVGGLLAHKLADTLKTAIAGPGGIRVASTVDRSDKWLAQTPQMFRIGALIGAIERIGPTVTDEASAMEAIGLHPRLVQASALNFKVTYPDDFVLAEAVLAQRAHGGTLDRFGGERGVASDAPARTIF